METSRGRNCCKIRVEWKGKEVQLKWDSVVFGVEKGQNARKTRIQFKESTRTTKIKEHLKVLFLSLNKK